MAEKTHHLCARLVPTLQPEEKVTFPMYKKKLVYSENGDVKEEFVELSEEEKKNLRASSPYVDCGNMKDSSPLPRDKFEVLDEMRELYESLTEEDIEELRKLAEKD